jgi:hypothetical protein
LSEYAGEIGLFLFREWIVKQKKIQYLTIILGEVDLEYNQKTDGGTVQILIIQITNWKERSKTELTLENSSKLAKVRIGV